MDYTFRWNAVVENWAYLLSGIWVTLGVTAAALTAASVFGLLVGLARLSRRRSLSLPAKGYIGLFRNTPVLVQLVWVYYCLPILTGIDFSAIASCTIALSLNGSAYMAEIFRGSIQSIERGQFEAARASGLSYIQMMLKIILPQAVRRMIPPFVNEAVTLLKYSSLVSVLGVADLMYQAQALSTTTFRPIEIFTSIAVVYFILCSTLANLAQMLENRLAAADQ